MKPVALGVIGCGVIGPVHLQCATQSPLIKVVAVADLIDERARAAAEKFGVQKVYGEGESLLADDEVEAVVLAMPTHGRTQLALSAFEKGKHVLTEKPVAMNAHEVRQMIRARGDLTAGCCSPRYRFTESSRAAADLIATGVLGDLRVVHCRAVRAARERPATSPPPWRLSKALNGGGILVNWGCYDLDYLLGITGWTLKPRLVLAQTWPLPPRFESHADPDSDAESHFAALIQCEGGTVISFERGEYMAAQTEEAWRIVGSHGSLRLTMVAKPEKAIVHDYADEERGVLSETIWQGDEGGEAIGRGLLEDFAAAIREGRQPMTSLENALVMQQITDAIYASAEQGAAVEIAP